MGRSPIDMMLDGVKWVRLGTEDEFVGTEGDLPRATHKGILTIMDCDLICYQLSDGRRIIEAQSLEKFFDTKVCP